MQSAGIGWSFCHLEFVAVEVADSGELRVGAIVRCVSSGRDNLIASY
jgi:hypothetical protein